MLPLRMAALGALMLPAVAAAQTVGPADPNAPRRPASATPGEVSHEAPVNGVLTLYGNQRCPTDKSGNEVVVCVRRGAAEQFRIPKELREFTVTPQNESWAKNQHVTLTAGQQGMGTCTVGMLGSETGCLAQQARASKADNAQRKKEAAPDLSGY